MEEWSIAKYQIPSTKLQITMTEVSVFRFQCSGQTEVSVFPAAASLQTGFPLRSNRFQFFVFLP